MIYVTSMCPRQQIKMHLNWTLNEFSILCYYQKTFIFRLNYLVFNSLPNLQASSKPINEDISTNQLGCNWFIGCTNTQQLSNRKLP